MIQKNRLIPAPEGLPAGGSGTVTVDFSRKVLNTTVQTYPVGGATEGEQQPPSNISRQSPLPIIQTYPHWGRSSGGAKPRERRLLLLFNTGPRFNNKIHAAAPEGRPGGGSGTSSVDFPK
jgi:hypothetical protein